MLKKMLCALTMVILVIVGLFSTGFSAQNETNTKVFLDERFLRQMDFKDGTARKSG